MRDLYSNLAALPALAPAVQAAAVAGLTVDLAPATGVVFALSTGAIVGSGDFGAKVEESADGSAWGDAPAKWVKSNAPATLLAASSYRLGYTGKLRYARLSLTKAGGTSIAAGAVAVIKPLRLPVA
jgi:hypothetical protein